jgi:DNA-binding NarL/FixJ family response regulator
MIKVVVCDGHVFVRKGISAIISTLNGYTVEAEVENGILLLDLIHKGLEVDIVLMDVSMQLLDSFSVASKLCAMPSHPHILAFSIEPSVMVVQKMVKAGARGFISKDYCEKLLEKALIDMHDKGCHLNKHVTLDIIKAATNLPDASLIKQLSLTKKEEELLPALCSGKPYKEIAKEQYTSYKTLDNHCQNIFRKLNVNSRNQLVTRAFQLGLVHSI